MPKRVSYNSVKSANKILFRQKFRYLHLHKTPVFVLLSAAALKACGGGGGSSGGGTEGGSVSFAPNGYSLVSVDAQSDNSYTISENSQPVLRDDGYYYLLGSVLEGTKIVNPDTPENNIYFALDSRELYLIHSQIIDFEAHSSHVYGITLEKSGISSALRFSPSDVPQDEEYEIHSVVDLDTSDALSYVYEVDEVIEGGSNDVIASFSIDTASVVLSLEGADKNAFDFNNGKLIFKNAPDFETKSEYELILVSTQDGIVVQRQNFKVSVLDVDEAPVITSDVPDAASTTFDENVEVDTLIVTLAASDPDDGDDISWSIVSGNDEGLFAIGSDAGELVFDKSPDFEIHGASRSLIIQASSIGSSGEVKTDSLELTITINDKDEAPVITTPALDAFDENVEAGTSIVDLDASDDALDIISWSIVSGNDDGLFAIGSDTGELVFDKSPDFETHGASRTLTIEASSIGSSGVEKTGALELTIIINDKDEAPVIVQPDSDTFTRNENVTAGTSIVDLDASDDALDIISWSIISGNDDGLFAIGSDTGELVFDKSPDFETHGASRTLTIEASSIGSSGVEKTGTLELTITINDEDEAPVITTPALDAFDENVAVGTSIVDLDASDDALDIISWSIVSGNDDGLFAIGSDTGELVFDKSPDFETHGASRTLTIEASSIGSSGVEKTGALELTIIINDKDEAPVIVQPDSDTFTRNENVTAGTSIVDLDASDDALDIISWSIISGNDDGLFAIGSDTGELVFDKSPDFETHGASRTLTIEASSIGSSGVEKTGTLELTITINDEDEAPVITTPALDAFDENVAVGTSIVDLDASDDALDIISWSIVSGNDDGLFAIGSDTGELVFDKSPDFETHGASRTLTIEASSTGSSNIEQSAEQVLTITINDVDEAPVITTPALDAFDENVAVGTSIVDLDASDDALDIISWSIISGNDDGLFAIGSDTGELVFDKSPDFETHGASRTLTIEASSIGSSGVEKTGTLELTITINDVDDAPVFTGEVLALANNPQASNTVSDLTIQLNEEIEYDASDLLARISASDPDTPQDTVTLSLKPGSSVPDGIFFYNLNEVILYGADFDYENTPDLGDGKGYSFTILATESDRTSSELTVNIEIVDVDEAPVIATPALDAFDENIATLSITTITASDDALDIISWSIVSGNDDGLFAIGSDTGELVFDKSPDFETHGASRSLIIQASSIGSSGVEKTGTLELTITINDEKEAPFRNDEADYQASESLNLVGASELIVNVSDLLLRFRDPEGNINKIVFDTSSPEYGMFTISYNSDSDGSGSYVDLSNNTLTLADDDISDDTIKIVPKTRQGDTAPTTGFKSFSYSVIDSDDLSSIGGSAVLKFNVEDDDAPVFTWEVLAPANNPPSGTVSDLTIQLNENQNYAASDLLARISASDPDGLDTVTLSVKDDTTPDGLSFDVLTGELSIGASAVTFDYEATPDLGGGKKGYSFTILATESDRISSELTINIEIVDVEEPPVFTGEVLAPANNPQASNTVSDLTIQLNEEVEYDASALLLATISASDPDTPQDTVTLSLKGDSSVPAGFVFDFADDELSGELSIASAVTFNYENLPDLDDGEKVYSFTLVARENDAEETSSELTVNIEIVDVDEAPVINTPALDAFDENIATLSITTLTAEDDAGDIITWSIFSGNDDDLFTIDSDGVLSFKESPNFETHGASRTLTIRASSTGSSNIELSDSLEVLITINDVDEAPFRNDEADYQASENLFLSTGSELIVNVSDLISRFDDPEDNINKIVFDTNSPEYGMFTISYNSDSDGSGSYVDLSSEDSLTLADDDISDDTIKIVVAPNASPDIGLKSFSYSVIDSDDLPSIGGNADGSAVLEFNVADKAPEFTWKVLSIANNHQASGTVGGLLTIQLNENQVFNVEVLARVYVADPSIPSDDVTLSLKDGTIPNKFFFDVPTAANSPPGDVADGHIIISEAVTFDHEDTSLTDLGDGKKGYSFTLLATESDDDDTSSELTINIEILGVNEVPVRNDEADYQASENLLLSAGNELIVNVSELISRFNDPEDNINKIVFDQTSTDYGKFSISYSAGGSDSSYVAITDGIVTLSDYLDVSDDTIKIVLKQGEVAPMAGLKSFSYSVRDAGGLLSSDAVLEFNTMEDKVPEFTWEVLGPANNHQASGTVGDLLTIQLNEAIEYDASALLATISATDPDGLDTVTLSVKDDTIPDRIFFYNPDTVVSEGRIFVKYKAYFDYEATPVLGDGKGYSFTISATESDGTSSELTVNIEIVDVDEAPVRNDDVADYQAAESLNLADTSELIVNVSDLISRFNDPEDNINEIVFDDTISTDYDKFSIYHSADGSNYNLVTGNVVALYEDNALASDVDVSDDTIKIVVAPNASPMTGPKSFSYSVRDSDNLVSTGGSAVLEFNVVNDILPEFTWEIFVPANNPQASGTVSDLTIQLNENQNYAALATLASISATDYDGEDTELTLSLKDNTIHEDFVFANGELSIASSAVTFDHEATDVIDLDGGGKGYSFTILATESDYTFSELTVNIEIVDVDEKPVRNTLDNYRISEILNIADENSELIVNVSELTSRFDDHDEGDVINAIIFDTNSDDYGMFTISYNSDSDGSGSYVDLSENSLTLDDDISDDTIKIVVAPNASPTIGLKSFSYSVRDVGGLLSFGANGSAVLEFNTMNDILPEFTGEVFEPASNYQNSGTVSDLLTIQLNEQQSYAASDLLATIDASDPEDSDTVTLSLKDGSSVPADFVFDFADDELSGELEIASSTITFDYEATPDLDDGKKGYSFTLLATESDGTSSELTVNIEIVNVNEAPVRNAVADYQVTGNLTLAGDGNELIINVSDLISRFDDPEDNINKIVFDTNSPEYGMFTISYNSDSDGSGSYVDLSSEDSLTLADDDISDDTIKIVPNVRQGVDAPTLGLKSFAYSVIDSDDLPSIGGSDDGSAKLEFNVVNDEVPVFTGEIFVPANNPQASGTVSDLTIELDENQDYAALTLLATISASDPSIPPDTITLSLKDGIILPDGLSFDVPATDASMGTINVLSGADFDYEDENLFGLDDGGKGYSFTILATESDYTFSEFTVNIEIVDRNDKPVITTGTVSYEIAEDIPLHRYIVDFDAYDDDGDTISWSIFSGNDDGLFAIGSSSGNLIVINMIDFEEHGASHTLVIQASSSGGTDTQELTITITNVEEAPERDPLVEANYLVTEILNIADENSELIVNVSDLISRFDDPEDNINKIVFDKDSPEYDKFSISYSADGSNYNDPITDGIVTLSDYLDFSDDTIKIVPKIRQGDDTPTLVLKSFSYSVIDAGNLPSIGDNAVLEFNVVNDILPEFTGEVLAPANNPQASGTVSDLLTIQLNEQQSYAASDLLATIDASDPDGLDTVTLSVKDDTTPDGFVFANGELSIGASAVTFDHEATDVIDLGGGKKVYSFTILATESDGISSELTINIEIVNLNESPIRNFEADYQVPGNLNLADANSELIVNVSDLIKRFDDPEDNINKIVFDTNSPEYGMFTISYNSDSDGSGSYVDLSEDSLTLDDHLDISDDTIKIVLEQGVVAPMAGLKSFSYSVRDTSGLFSIDGSDDGSAVLEFNTIEDELPDFTGEVLSIANNPQASGTVSDLLTIQLNEQQSYAASDLLATIDASDPDTPQDEVVLSVKDDILPNWLSFDVLTDDASMGTINVLSGADFDYEITNLPVLGDGKKGYSFTLLATESDGISSELTVNIEIVDINEAPIRNFEADYQVPGNLNLADANSELIVNVSELIKRFTDYDEGDVINAIVFDTNSDDYGMFTISYNSDSDGSGSYVDLSEDSLTLDDDISDDTIKIVLKQGEVAPMAGLKSFSYSVRDVGGLLSSDANGSAELKFNTIEDAVPEFTGTLYDLDNNILSSIKVRDLLTIQLNEQQSYAASDLLAKISTSDPEDSDTVTLSLKGDSSVPAGFVFDFADGELSIASAVTFNYEDENLPDLDDGEKVYSFTLVARENDAEETSSELTVNIEIVDVNEVPERDTDVEANFLVPGNLTLAGDGNELIVNVSELISRFDDPDGNINKIVFDQTSTEYDKFSISYSADGSNYNLVTGNVVTLYEDNALASEIDVSDDTIKIVPKTRQGDTAPTLGLKSFSYSVIDAGNLPSIGDNAVLEFNVVNDILPEFTGEIFVPANNPQASGTVSDLTIELNENQNYAALATLASISATDYDGLDTELTLSLKDNTIHEDFVFANGELSIASSAVTFDHEATDVIDLDGGGKGYSFTILATESDYTFSELTVNIEIVDVDEKPVRNTLDNYRISEILNIADSRSELIVNVSELIKRFDDPEGDVIDQIIFDTSSADYNKFNIYHSRDGSSYSLITSGGLVNLLDGLTFKIVLKQGEVAPNAGLKSFSYVIFSPGHLAVGGAALEFNTMNDILPEFTGEVFEPASNYQNSGTVSDSFTIQLNEEVEYAASALLARISTSDPDGLDSDTVTLSLKGGSSVPAGFVFDFADDELSGELSIASAVTFNYENLPDLDDGEKVYSFTLVARENDAEETSSELTVNIEIVNVNEAPVRNAVADYQVTGNLTLAGDGNELIINVSDLISRFNDPEDNINEIVFDQTSTEYDKFSISYSADGSNYNLVTGNVVTLYEDNALASEIDVSDDTIKIVPNVRQGVVAPTTGFKFFSYSVRDAGNLPSIGGSAVLKFGVKNSLPEWSYGYGDITLGNKISPDDDVTLLLKGAHAKPIDFSKLAFSREDLGDPIGDSIYYSSTPIIITIPESGVGTDDGGSVTIGYINLGAGSINADILQIDRNGYGIINDFEIPVLPQRQFNEWDESSITTPTVAGTDEAELIIGSSLRDFIRGGEGDDYIYSLGGNDRLEGGIGDDQLYGGVGDDHLNGGEGVDQLYGGADNDTLYGDAGDDTLYGGDGDDILYGDDTLLTEGNDHLYGGNGNDRFHGSFGDDELSGGAGNDEYYYSLSHGHDTIIEDSNQGAEDILYLNTISTSKVWSFEIYSEDSLSLGDLRLNLGVNGADNSIILKSSLTEVLEEGIEQIHFDNNVIWYHDDSSDESRISFEEALGFTWLS